MAITTTSTKTNHKRKGIALIWMSFIFLVILGFMAILIDFGRGYLAVHQIHNAADAAALAGVRYVPVVYDPNSDSINLNAATDIAHYYGLEHISAKVNVFLDADTHVYPEDYIDGNGDPIPVNPYDPSLTADIVIGRYNDDNGLFFVDHDSPDAMMVIARRDGTANHPLLGLIFGSGFGKDSAKFERFAIAKVDPDYGAGVLALGECPDCPGIEFDGVGAEVPLTILNGGSLHVNSSSDEAVFINSKNIILDLERLTSVGGLNDKFYDSMASYPEKYADSNIQNDMGAAYIEPDPFAYLPNHDLAAIKALPDKGTITDANDTQTLLPGYYSGGLQISGGTTINLSPGDYYLDSIGQAASLSMNSTNDLITGTDGVTLHIIGDADLGINIKGGNIDISAPTTGTYAGVGIYQKRDPTYSCAKSCAHPWNSAAPISNFNGNGILNVDGAVYMPHNRLELGGTGELYMERVVADRMLISGSGLKEINYKGKREIAPQSWLVK
jgi:hypothetical protein